MHMQIVDHFGNGIIRNSDPENLGVDTLFILLSHTLSELGRAKKWNFGNGRLICILLKMLKGGIIQMLDHRPSEKQERPKN